MIINQKRYPINDYIRYDEYGINKNDKFLMVILTGVDKITDASSMFSECKSLQSLPDISKWDTKNVESMDYMFCGCKSLQSLPDISKWDTKNVKRIKNMFNGCKSLQSLSFIEKFKIKKFLEENKTKINDINDDKNDKISMIYKIDKKKRNYNFRL